MRQSLRQSVFQVVKLSLTPKIVFPFLSFLIYSFLIVLFLKEVNVWKTSNLKETIYWFFFSGIILSFGAVIDNTSEKPIRKIVKELVVFTIIVEFIVNTYVFKLPVELILVPLVAILTAIYTYACFKAEYKAVEKIVGTILGIIGVAILIHALIQIHHDFNKFARLDTFIDFILPLVLTLSILPAIYLLLLYISYENLFITVDILLNSKEMKRYAKRLLVLHCGFRVGRVREIVKFRAGRLYGTASKEEIRTILLQDENIPIN